MTDHSGLLGRYKRLREAGVRLNHLLIKTIPKTTLDECGAKLGFVRKGVFYFDVDRSQELSHFRGQD